MENIEILNYLEKKLKNSSFDVTTPKQKIIVEYFYIFIVSEIETKWKNFVLMSIQNESYKFLDKNIISKMSEYFFERSLSDENINNREKISRITGKILLREDIDDFNKKLFIKLISDFLNNKTWNNCNVKKDISILLNTKNKNNHFYHSLIIDNFENLTNNDNELWKKIISERNKIVHSNYDIPITKIIPTEEYFQFARKIFNIINN